jgi:endonuclease/exonuclease/phosphatase family metal-dependent hydrolase
MPAFPKPTVEYDYTLAQEIAGLDAYRANKPNRQIPNKTKNTLLLVTWNIANLGLQKRREKDLKLIAHMLGWFDIAAIQEVNDNYADLKAIVALLPKSYRMLISDAAGNNERVAFVYDSSKVEQLEKVGEIAIPPAQMSKITLPGSTQTFKGFDRNPYIAAFKAGNFTFQLANVHLFYGSKKKTDIDRRCLETFAVARWCDLRRKSKYAYCEDIIALGDFNLPECKPGDPVYDALISRGLKLPAHGTQVPGSNLTGSEQYDQLAFFPTNTGEYTGKIGVFDFDGAVFKKLWDSKGQTVFRAYVRYYLSDHRPMWAQFTC